MGQIGGVYIPDELMPAAPTVAAGRPSLGAIFGGAAQQAYGQVRYGLPLALQVAAGTDTPESQAAYKANLEATGAAARRAAPSSAGDLFSGRVGIGRFLAENVASMIPGLAAPVVGGVVGEAVGGPGGGVIGAVGAGTPQFAGAGAEHAIETNGKLTAESARRALLAAPVESAINIYAERFLPGAGAFLGKAAATQTGGLVRRMAISALESGSANAAAGVVTQAGDRFVAGQPIASADAVGDYVNAAATGFTVGGVLGAAGGIRRTAAHAKPAADVTPDDLNEAIDAGLSGRQLPGPAPLLALPAPGEGVPIPAGNDLRRPDFQVDPRGNVAPANAQGTADLAATPVGDVVVDSQGNAIPSPTSADLSAFANRPAEPPIHPAITNAYLGALAGEQRFPDDPQVRSAIDTLLNNPQARRGAQLDLGLPEGTTNETQLPLFGRSGVDAPVEETPASRLPQLPLDRGLSEAEPGTQLSLGDRLRDDVSDPNVRVFQNDSFTRLQEALKSRSSSTEVKAAATAEIAHRTAEAVGQAPLTGDFQTRLSELKNGLRSQFIEKLTADNPQQLVNKVYDAVFEDQNTQANVTKLAQRMGLLDDKLEPTDFAKQVEAQKAGAADEAIQAQAEAATQFQPTEVGKAPPEGAPAAPAAPARAEAVSIAPQTVDPEFGAKWNQLKSQAGIERNSRALTKAGLDATPPNEAAARAQVFRALADDSSNAATSQVEKLAQKMGLISDDDARDVTPAGRQAYLATPEGRADITAAATQQGYTDAAATTFDRGVQAQLGGPETITHTSFEDMAAYQAGKVWAQDFVERSGVTAAQSNAILYRKGEGRAAGSTPAERGGAARREQVKREPLSPGQVQAQSLNRLLDAADLRGVNDSDAAALRRMVRDGSSPEEVGRALAQVQGGKTLFKQPEPVSRELPPKPVRGQPIFKEMNPERARQVERKDAETAIRTFRLREVIKQALLDKEITTAKAERLNDLLDRGQVDAVGRVVTNFDANSIGAYVREGEGGYRPTGEADLDHILSRPGRLTDGPTFYPPQQFGPLDRRSSGREPASGLRTGKGMNDREMAAYRKARWAEKQEGGASAAAVDRLADDRRTSGASDLQFEQAVQGKTFHESLQHMVDNAPSPYLGAVMKGVQGLASKLEGLGQKFEMHVVHIGDQAPRALLGRGTRALALHTVEPPVSAVWLKGADLGPAAGSNYQVAAHEMLHSVTMRAFNYGLRNDQINTKLGRTARDLRDLGNAIVKHFNDRYNSLGFDKLTPIEQDIYKQRTNALADVHEVFAWGMTNPEFQSYLQTIDYKPRESVFQRMVGLVRDMLGIDGKYGTALTELMRVSEQVMGLDERDLAPVFGRDDPRFGETGTVQAHLSEGGASAANRTVTAANDTTKMVAETISKAAERIKPQNLKGKVRREALGWMSQNHLDREYGAALPAMLDRSAAKRNHDAVRGRIVSLGDQAVQRFQALEQASKPLSEKLGKLMGLAAEFRIDPEKAFDAHDHLRDADNVTALRGLHDQALKLRNDLSRGDGAGYKLFQEFRAFNEMQNYAHFATDLHSLVALDPELSLGIKGGNDNPMDAFLTRDDVAASSDAARGYWRDTLDAQLKAAEAFVRAKKGEAAAGTAADIRGMNQHLAPIEEKISSIREAQLAMARAPYFHLGRFGDYFGSAVIRKLENGAVDPKAQAHVAQVLADAGFKHVQISTDNTRPKFSARFDSVDATKRFEALMVGLHKEGWLDGDLDSIKSGPRELTTNTGVQAAFPQHVAAILAAIDTNPAYVPEEDASPKVKSEMAARKQEAMQIVRDAYLEQQPDSAISKVLSARYTVPGYDPDMIRNFSHRASVGATALANKAVSARLGNAWRDMRSQLVESRSAGSPHDQYLLSDLVGELQQREAVTAINPTAGTYEKLTAIAHPYYLGLSPAYAMVQLTQIGMNALPELAKTHGYGSSFHALRRASTQAFSIMRAATNEALKGGWKHAGDVVLTEPALQAANLSKGQIDFMRRMIAGGSIDIGQAANALSQIARHGTNAGLETTLKLASAVAIHSETFSRLVVALAAHELHGGDDVQAKANYATDVVSNSMFDFQGWNKARQLGRRGFLGPVTPLLTQFMTFSTQMTEKLYSEIASAAGRARPGEAAEVTAQRAKEARTYLLGHLTAVTALSGTLGLPFASVFATAIEKIVNTTRGPNDDPFDATAAWRNFLADVLGKDVAEVVARGAPRAVGADLSGRVGEADLLPFSKLLGDKRSWREAVGATMSRATGAAPDMLLNLADAGHAFGNGDILGGAIAAAPTAFKGPLKAYQMSTQGYVDTRGRQLPMTPGARDILYQLMGFMPGDKAEYQEARVVQQGRRTQLSDTANGLRTSIVRAMTTGDTDRARDLITRAQEFDRNNPSFAVIPSLAGAVERQAQARAQARALGTPLGVSPRDIAGRRMTGYANINFGGIEAMSFSDAAETAIMSLIFNATAWANMADNAGSSPQTNVAVALHTADPGESGTMQSSEAAYTSYARVNVPRTNVGWTVTGNSVSPAANIDFPAGTGGSGTIAFFSTGKTGGGAAAIHMSGTVTPNIVSGNGVTPRLTTATALTID